MKRSRKEGWLKGMQRIYACPFSIREYVEGDGHEQVVREAICAMCGHRGGLHRHATYERAVVDQGGKTWRIRVARFICTGCGKTLSYLPRFALSYRLVSAEGFEAYLEGECERLDVRRHFPLLQGYRRRMEAFALCLYRIVGYGFGRAPPNCVQQVWAWLKEAGGGIESATCRLVSQFALTLFGRYRCHQKERVKNAAFVSDVSGARVD